MHLMLSITCILFMEIKAQLPSKVQEWKQQDSKILWGQALHKIYLTSKRLKFSNISCQGNVLYHCRGQRQNCTNLKRRKSYQHVISGFQVFWHVGSGKQWKSSHLLWNNTTRITLLQRCYLLHAKVFSGHVSFLMTTCCSSWIRAICSL